MKRMNDIFNFSRFGRYFFSELKSLAANKGIAVLSFGLVPVYMFAILTVFSLFSSGHEYMSLSGRSLIFIFTAIIFMIWMPSACYGHVTDKRTGANYILVPVSSFEKTLSMLLNMLIVIPLAGCAAYMASDALTTLLAGHGAGETLACGIFSEEPAATATVNGNGLLETGNICISILTFLLGAVFFRRHKISKTILIVMAISIVLAAIGFSWDETTYISSGDAGNTITVTESSLTATACVMSIAAILLLCTGIYFRIRKIQY